MISAQEYSVIHSVIWFTSDLKETETS